jgi:hypothetical protein
VTKTPRKWLTLVVLCGTTLLGASCATNIRDAILGGALDFVSGSTSSLLSSLLPLVSAP